MAKAALQLGGANGGIEIPPLQSELRSEVSNPMVGVKPPNVGHPLKSRGTPPGYFGCKVRIRKELSMKLSSGTKCAAVWTGSCFVPGLMGYF